MANERHLKILRQGANTWNQWRSENLDVQVDLRGAELRDVDLRYADLHGANLQDIVLNRANLCWANLQRVNLRGANLSRAALSRADLSGADLQKAVLFGTDLRGTNLRNANFSQASLSGADFRDADLREVDFTGIRYSIDTLWPQGFELPASDSSWQAGLHQLGTDVYKNVTRATAEPIRNLRDAIDALEDTETKEKLQEQLDEYERIAEDTALTEQKRIDKEMEIQSYRIEKDIEVRYERAMSSMKVEEQQRRLSTFLDKEIWSVGVGAILLISLAVFIGVMTVQDRAEVRILENAFLILLGFFFSQGIAARRASETSTATSDVTGINTTRS